MKKKTASEFYKFHKVNVEPVIPSDHISAVVTFEDGMLATTTLPMLSAVYSFCPDGSQWIQLTVWCRWLLTDRSLSGFCLLSIFSSITWIRPFLVKKKKSWSIIIILRIEFYFGWNLLNKISLSKNLLINACTFVLNTYRGIKNLRQGTTVYSITFTLTEKNCFWPEENNTFTSNFKTNIYICSILKT